MTILPMMTALGARYQGSPVTTPLGAARLGFVLGSSPMPEPSPIEGIADVPDVVYDDDLDIDVEDPDADAEWLDVPLDDIEDDRLLESFR